MSNTVIVVYVIVVFFLNQFISPMTCNQVIVVFQSIFAFLFFVPPFGRFLVRMSTNTCHHLCHDTSRATAVSPVGWSPHCQSVTQYTEMLSRRKRHPSFVSGPGANIVAEEVHHPPIIAQRTELEQNLHRRPTRLPVSGIPPCVRGAFTRWIDDG
ncbi:hypothetical protein EDB89DRAFT_1940496 [Lactarius sanguifluus]|nr:hypothetical protein EDB89DRAFT_1940496 [Lactarius sanguifluus]